MASANAMARIDWTITGVADPGFRPTASAALAPIKPTARAAPRAAIPTCRLPLMCLSRPFLVAQPCRDGSGQSFLDSIVPGRPPFLVMLTDQQREDGGQQREHQRLHQTNQQFQKVKGNLYERADVGNAGHRVQHRFPGEDVAVETKTERDRPEQDRDDFQATGGEEHDEHEYLQSARALTFRRKQLLEEPLQADFLHGPDDPAPEEDERHGERHVHVGIGAAEQWLLDREAGSGPVTPSDRTDARNQADPVRGENEDEDGAEEPERPFNQVMAEDPLEKAVEPLDEPLQKVLRSFRDLLHGPRRGLGKEDERHGDDPRHDYRVGDRKAQRPGDLDRLL